MDKASRDTPGASLVQDAGVWAAVSHEIRTPLMGVVGMLEVLGHTSLTEEQRRIIATAENSSIALMRIVDDVLDFAKLESSSVSLAPAPADLGPLLEECAAQLANPAGAKGLALLCEADTALPPVLCDAMRIRQLVLNLGGNAVKFTDYGAVAVSARLQACDGRHASVRLSVRDSGIGIPADLRPFLFQPFSQLAAGGLNRGGAGLGLAICRRIVEIMGGAIAVESAAGEGTTFNIDLTLPLAGALPAPDQPLQGTAVLLVDGGDPVLAAAARYLEAAGADVTPVRSLNDVLGRLDAATSDQPPLVVIGPDAEAGDIAAVGEALETMNRTARLLWLRPRSAPGLLRQRIATLSAHPLRRADLIAAARRPAEALAPEAVVTRRNTAHAPMTPVETAAAARAEGRVILVVEDNPVNQEVLQQQLSILGFDCDIADNGAGALRLLQEGRYLLALCDCHMPGIDGFELTRIIRADEQRARQPGASENGARRLPIIAVTANALPGESARCLAAGMDDYLAKPIEIRSLHAALQRWLAPEHRGVAAVAPPITPARPDAVVNTRNLEAIYGGDPVRLSRVLGEWRDVVDRAVKVIAGAIPAARHDEALEAAHRIKGSAGIAGAYSLSAAAGSLETALRNHDFAGARQAAGRVESLALTAMAEVARITAGYQAAYKDTYKERVGTT